MTEKSVAEIRQQSGGRDLVENHISYSDPDDPLFRRLVIKLVERLTGQPRLQRLYDDYLKSRMPNDIFWDSAISYMNVTVRYDHASLAAIPKSGPLVIVSNHPFGVLDGIAIGHLMTKVRQDFKLLAHAALGRAEVFRPYLIPIEFEGASTALRANVTAKRTALEHLDAGRSLIIFPAGRVSTASSTFGRAVDAPWKLFTGKLIARSKATVVPVFFEGQNGPLFHFASKFSEALREALLLREVAKRIGSHVTAHIGAPLSSDALARFDDRQALLDFIRAEIYAMDPHPYPHPDSGNRSGV